jgi:hypothetical protein
MALGRKTGGRRKGTPNKVTAARQAMLQDTAARVMAGRSGGFPGDAHALLVAIYRDESLRLSMRLDAAKSAVKFERPALASTMVTQKDALDEQRRHGGRRPGRIDRGGRGGAASGH